VALQISEPLGTTSVDHGIVETLRKCLAGTSGVEAPEPPGSYIDRHGSPMRRQITKLSQIMAVDPPRA
jgi:hypothetical protein